MKHLNLKSFVATAATAILLATSPASAKELNLTLAGASPGGLWTLLGAGLEAALKAGGPGSSVVCIF